MQILNDESSLGVIERASLQWMATSFRHCLMGLAFYSQRGRTPLCPSVMARDMANLLMVNLHPTGGLETWSGNQISTSILPRVYLDEVCCPLETQPFPQATLLL